MSENPLKFDHASISPVWVVFEEMVVGALFDNLTVVNHGNDIGVSDGGKPVSNDNCGSGLHHAVQGLLHGLL